MEVASPIPFAQNMAGTKRHLTCSPGLVDPSNRSPFGSAMEGSDEYLGQRFKRRRFTVDTHMDGDSENNVNFSLSSSQHHQQKELFASSGPLSAGQSLRRCRVEAFTPPQETQRIIDNQTNEIDSLKHQNSSLEESLTSLQSDHGKVLNENKILKRAVAIQQERQNQAAGEIQAARQYRVDAEDRIKKLEQIILSLRYHLQTQQSNPPNDFMGFPPRPPDVY